MNPWDVKTRFEKLHELRPFTERWLAEATNVSRHSVKKILSGEIRTNKDNALFRTILQKLGTDENAFFGRGATESGLRISTTAPDSALVPIYGEIPAGNPTWFEPTTVPADFIATPPGTPSNNHFALRVSGESMLPRFEQGDVVYFERLNVHLGVKDPENPVPFLTFERLNGRVVAVLIDGEATMKQLKVVGDGESYALLLKAFNPEFRTITIKATNEVSFQGMAVSMLRQKL